MKEEVIKYLSECNLVELNHIVYSALNSRSDCSSEVLDGEYEYQSKILLCEVEREKFKGESWQGWEYFLLASEDKETYDESWVVGNGEPFVQLGSCESCKTKLASHAKKAICPMCGESVGLT